MIDDCVISIITKDADGKVLYVSGGQYTRILEAHSTLKDALDQCALDGDIQVFIYPSDKMLK